MKTTCNDILEAIQKTKFIKNNNEYMILKDFLEKNKTVIIDIANTQFNIQFDNDYANYIIRIYKEGMFEDYKIVAESDDSYELVSAKKTNVVWGISDHSPSNILSYLDIDVQNKVCDKYELIHLSDI